MVVQSLCHEVNRQGVLVAGGFLDFGPFVLKPDLDLGLVEAEFLSQALPPLLCQVAVRLKLRFESLQLLGGEGGPGPFVLFAGVLLLWFAGSGPCCRSGREKKETEEETREQERLNGALGKGSPTTVCLASSARRRLNSVNSIRPELWGSRGRRGGGSGHRWLLPEARRPIGEQEGLLTHCDLRSPLPKEEREEERHGDGGGGGWPRPRTAPQTPQSV